MEDSWRQLQDQPKRQRYRESLLEPTQLGFSADLLIAQGRTAELQRRWKDARDLYETAHELRPAAESDRALKLLDAREYEWMKRLREKQNSGDD